MPVCAAFRSGNLAVAAISDKELLVQLKKHGIVLVSALCVLPVAAAAADEECCPSEGNGVRMMQSLAASSAPPTECCPTGGNGLVAGTGMGLAKPNTLDLSTYPGWHTYAFMRDGIRYVQINDDVGKVHAAIATANGSMLVLPMGEDEVRRVSMLPAGRPMYDDGTVAIAPSITPTGSIVWLVKTAQ